MELEDSLRRLGTDYIDLYQVHWPDLLIRAEETAALLAEFLREGKVGALGVSNYSVAQMEAFRSACCWVSLIYLLALLALPFLPETKGQPMPEG